MTLRKEKCNFFKDTVEFLGYKLSKEGCHVPESRIEAISKVPTPKTITDVKAFLGLVNFYNRFVPQLSTIAEPLYRLLKKNIRWYWGEEQKSSFQSIKNKILSKQVLIPYDSEEAVILYCDASPIGIGGVLTHRIDGVDKPIAFCSRILSDSERNYSQIDREALGIVFCVHYFHQYLYGRDFIIKTDNKPLKSIFGPKKGIPEMAAQRLQRYAIFLSGYNFKIEFIKGDHNGGADAMSRLPLKFNDRINFDASDNFYVNLITDNVRSISFELIEQEIKNDKELKEIFGYVSSGHWLDSSKEISEELRPYYYRKNELSLEKGCIMWGHRVVIPRNFRKDLLDELHSRYSYGCG